MSNIENPKIASELGVLKLFTLGNECNFPSKTSDDIIEFYERKTLSIANNKHFVTRVDHIADNRVNHQVKHPFL